MSLSCPILCASLAIDVINSRVALFSTTAIFPLVTLFPSNCGTSWNKLIARVLLCLKSFSNDCGASCLCFSCFSVGNCGLSLFVSSWS